MKRATAVTLTLQDHGLDVISYMIHRVSKKNGHIFQLTCHVEGNLPILLLNN